MNNITFTVPILEKHISKAKEYANKSLHHTYNRIDYDDDHLRKDKIFIGKIGEGVFMSLLEENKIKFILDKTTEKEEDEFDIKVGNLLIDIKSVSYEPNKVRLLEVKTRYDNPEKKYDFYVGIKLNEDFTEATIWGYATNEDIGNAPVDIFTTVYDYWIYLKDLRPIKELIEILKNETNKKLTDYT